MKVSNKLLDETKHPRFGLIGTLPPPSPQFST
jgi:hypothetical protein